MITEDYVYFETAKLLKEKGFDEKCHHYWQYDKANDKDDVDGICLCCCDGVFELNNSELDTLFGESLLNFGYSAPTLQMAMKWLREVHGLHIEIRITNHSISSLVNVIKYYWVVFGAENAKWETESTVYTVKAFDKYEEAAEAGIKHCLEKLI